MEPILGLICIFGGNFAPRGWATCQGQTLSIAQNTALFSLLGTIYGGDGVTTFRLPDLQGRVAVGQGQGPGLPPVSLGEIAGTPNVTLTSAQMPQHVHGSAFTLNIKVSDESGSTNTPTTTENVLGSINQADGTGVLAYGNITPNVTLNTGGAGIAGNTTVAGGSQPFSITQPYLGVNYIIALEGVYPSRS
jgi:microcystin-dependent protein